MSRPVPIDLPTADAVVRESDARMAPLVEVEAVFTPEECRRIIARREVLGFDDAPIPTAAAGAKARAHQVDRSVRDTLRTHLLPTPEHAWIFDRLGAVVATTNDHTWRFRIAFMEPLQHLSYPEGGHFLWHSDLGDRGIASLRKVSATILLSAPGDYDGGDLQLLVAGKEITPGRGQGKAVLFPSFMNHRVTAVTRGVRHVLILWNLGRHALR